LKYLSDVNLRAVLAVLIERAGGTVEIANDELYDVMSSHGGQYDSFEVQETPSGVRLTRTRRTDEYGPSASF